ncbi:hypothetical protein Terro_0688 [Terriglobus roseus DSM 18391]|uniref:O-antigen ligase like membrane protein n=1 Tax=Terriglobus roseus (strain DSM 18391 / NRRL B-41598 / KBS 63) TaxID=926566 RepID=I3ZCQ7_TERRK|nr:hypothetical protein [Terriglobus roseus]AFL87025.1 hypothetical protein Terro_0688 [Terriglobus roseus DSM 18391]
MRPKQLHPTAWRVFVALFVMLVVFPKGGFRLGGLPITWGYLMLFGSLVALMPYRMYVVKALWVRRQIVALGTLVPFALIFFYALGGYGASDSYQKNGVVSTSISLIFLPIVFLWFYPPMLPLLNRTQVMKCLRYCVLITALFGIFLFFWRPFTGINIHIPFLTTNGSDAGDPAATSNNSRGFFFKLISTYNNGNIYGAATLILLRLFDEATPRRWERWVVRTALFLTLSRTIWAGLIFNELLSLGAALLSQAQSFPRLRLGRTAKLTVAAVAFGPIFFLASKMMQRNEASFLLDPTLGGRTYQFQHLGEVPFFPNFQSHYMITEIVYLSSVNEFGYAGSVAVTILLLGPIGILLLDKRALQDPIRMAAFKGLVLYAFLCTSDGAIALIPVAAFYWFTYMIFLFGLPGRQPHVLGQRQFVAIASIPQERSLLT